MDISKKLWNENHKELRLALRRPETFAQAQALFLVLHAMVHSAEMSGSAQTTYEDEVWEDLEEPAARSIPNGCEHSIAWCFWHLSRIEDVTMNLLLAGTPQVYYEQGWFSRLNTTFQDTGNGMTLVEVARLGTEIDLAALRGYRRAVGRRTREIVAGITHAEAAGKVAPHRLEVVSNEGAVTPAVTGVLEYWGSLTGAGLLLMPPTRHALIHINEAAKIKKKAA